MISPVVDNKLAGEVDWLRFGEILRTEDAFEVE